MVDYHSYCDDCINSENKVCKKSGAVIEYTTFCSMKEKKEEVKEQTPIFACKKCVYSDLDSDFCYIIQSKPNSKSPDCHFLEWKPGISSTKEVTKEVAKKEFFQKDFTKKEEPKTTYVSYKECHKGTIVVFKDPKTGVEICGGGKHHDVVVTSKDLFLDVGFNHDKLIKTAGLKSAFKLEKYNKAASSIKIDWPDGSHPKLPETFWKDLISVIREEKKKVVISCVGGHGRTGTVLSILSVLMGVVKKTEDPVKFIRENYCKEAVETITQINYIKEVTKCDVKETPGKTWGGGQSTYFCNSSTKEDKKDSVTEKAIENLQACGVYDLLL